MRVLFIRDGALIDPLSEVAFGVRSLINGVQVAGHECQMLCGGRMRSTRAGSADDLVSQLGVPIEREAAPKRYIKRQGRGRRVPAGPDTVRFLLADMSVTMVLTGVEGGDASPGDLTRLDAALARLGDELEPQLVFAIGDGALARRGLNWAATRGCRTAFCLTAAPAQDLAGEVPVDDLWACGRYLAELAEQAAMACKVMQLPLDRRTILGDDPDEAGEQFLCYASPTWSNGAAPFARLAAMLGEHRPDIKVMILPQDADPRILNTFAEIDFGRYPRVAVAPPVRTPSEFLNLARLVVIPAVVAPSSGYLAAASMLSGVPVIVSDRGALPSIITPASPDEAPGPGGVVLPLPDSLGHDGRGLPDEADMQWWFDTVTALWDDPPRRRTLGDNGRQLAETRYDQYACRQTLIDWIEAIEEASDG
jgi:hypothetical protein